MRLRRSLALCAMSAWMLSTLTASSLALAAEPPLAMVPQVVPRLGLQRIAMSPDGRLVASEQRGVVHVWDVETGALIRVSDPRGRALYATPPLFLPDEKALLAVRYDLATTTIDLETGAFVRTTPPRAQGFSAAALSADGKWLLVGEEDGLVFRYDVRAGKVDRTFPGRGKDGTFDRRKPSPAWVREVQLSARGDIGLVTRNRGPIEIWDAARGVLLKKFEGGWPLALSADGSRMLTRTKQKSSFEVWDTRTDQLVREYPGDPARQMLFLPDGRRVIAMGSKELRLVELDTGKVVWSVEKEFVFEMALSPDGRTVLLVVGPRQLDLHDVEQGTRSKTLVADQPAIAAPLGAGFSPDGSRWFTVVKTGTYQGERQGVAWDVGRLGPDAFFDVSEGGGSGVWIAPASGRIWREKKHVIEAFLFGEEPRIWRTSEVRDVVLSRDGRFALGERSSATATESDFFDGSGQTLVRKALRPAYSSVRALSGDGRLAAATVAGPAMPTNPKSSSPGDVFLRGVDLQLFEIATGKPTALLSVGAGFIPTAAFSPDDTRIAVASICRQKTCDGDRFSVFDTKTGGLLFSAEQSFATVNALLFSSDGKKLAVGGSGEHTLELFDVATGKRERSLPGHSTGVDSLSFSPDNRFLLSGGPDGITRLSRLDKPDAVTLITSGDEWLVYSDDGLFDASRGGGELVAAVKGVVPYRIEKLAARNNRPDLLLERMGLGTPEIIAHYRARYERRLKKLGLTESALSAALGDAPEARIEDVKVEGDFATATFALAARGPELSRYNVFVNDVPLFGTLGKTLSGRSAKITEKIELGAGKNRIEVSALDRSGVESLRAYREVERARPAKRKLLYLGFGVSRYKNERYDLLYPHKDVRDLGEVLTAAVGQFVGVEAHTFVNEQATVENVRKAKALVRGAGVDDIVVLFIAGHGLHSQDAAADCYFATHELDVKRLSETAAPFELFEDLLAATPARQKLFLMDTCESGEREEALPEPRKEAGSRALRPRAARALELDMAALAKGPPTKRSYLLDKDRYIYNDLSRRTGAIVLSSSRGREFSYEYEEIQNGVFTEAMLRALTTNEADLDQDGLLSTDELRKSLALAVPKMTEDRQHPTVDRDNLTALFGLPIATSAAHIVTRSDVDVPDYGRARQVPVGSEPSRLAKPTPVRGCGCEWAGAPSAPEPWVLFFSTLGLCVRLGSRLKKNPGRTSKR